MNLKQGNSLAPERPRLLFFDIDGTLFDDEKKLPPSVKPALLMAHENGCLIFINTGRTLCNIDKRLYDLPIDGYSLGCGTLVKYKEEILVHKVFSKEETQTFTGIFRKLDIPVVYESDDGIYFDDYFMNDPQIKKFFKFATGEKINRRINDRGFLAVKMFCFVNTKDELTHLLDVLKSNGTPFLAIDRVHGYELVPEGFSKATGIDVIINRTGADISDCYAFGDSNNDLPMLQKVPNSVAMGNSPQDVKECCRYITDTPENDGIAKILQSLKII